MKTFIHSIICILFLSLSITAESQNDLKDFIRFKDSLNNNFRGDELSPLTEEQKEIFNELNFFDFNPKLIVKARFERKESDNSILLKTTTKRKPLYQVYGYLYFKIDGKNQRLTVLKSTGMSPDDEYADYLSVMFTDETTGDGSYAVGRYMGLHAPLPENITLNFNHTYNPYCAYGKRFSCPIPPRENHINLRVEAGVKEGFE